jgi:light-regulated signal transduction histidine kinase (bacteriophytochrome)
LIFLRLNFRQVFDFHFGAKMLALRGKRERRSTLLDRYGQPITKALIELHGGTLTLESTVGVGTTIALSFPKERVLEPGG